MKRQRRKYQLPKRPWDKERLETEGELIKKFGLKTKRELWKAQAVLRKYRGLARELVARSDMDKEKILKDKLTKLNILGKDATLDSVLSLTVEDFLNRRLQTVIFKKNLANTAKQARQFITHGNVLIENKKVVYPSYMVLIDEEDSIIVKVAPSKKIVSEENAAAN